MSERFDERLLALGGSKSVERRLRIQLDEPEPSEQQDEGEYKTTVTLTPAEVVVLSDALYRESLRESDMMNHAADIGYDEGVSYSRKKINDVQTIVRKLENGRTK